METQPSETPVTPNDVAVGLGVTYDRQPIDQACRQIDERRAALKKRLGELSVSSELLREIREP